MTVLNTSDILTQWKLYSLFKGPTNPYTIYANQDRFLNAVYRYYASGNLKNNYNLNHEGAGAEDHLPYSFQYEKQTNFLFQHFWAATALLGIGYSINSQNLGSSDRDEYNLAVLTTFRSVLAALIATAAYIGNVYRYDSQMLKNNFTASEKYPNFESYEKDVKNNRGELAVWTSIFLVINAIVGIGIAGKQLDIAINSNDDDKDKEEKIKLAGIALGALGANILTNTLKGFAAYGTLVDDKGITNYAPGTSTGFAIAGSILGMANATLSIAILAPLFSRQDLTETQRGVLAGEIVGQVGGGIVQAACNIALAIKLANGVSTGIGVVGPALGAAAAGVVLCLSPLEIYGLVQQSDYASQLDELGKEMAGYGYEGDSMLADLYRAKVAAEGGILAATTTLNLVGAVVSGLAAASVVGMPAAVFVGITMAALSGILKGVQQPILEKIADDFARKIEAQGGAFTFFGKSLDANYKQLVKSKAAINYLTSIQNGYGVNSVIGVSTVAMSATARELAAITRNAANAQANKSFIDRFKDGEVTADKNITIDTSKGIINTDGGNEQNKQLLTFLTPLMTPGDEQRGRVNTGKSAYANNLTITGSVKDWMINDGDSSSVMDVSDVATSAIDSDKKIIKNIGIIVNAGAGDDFLIAGAGDTKYDGGTGNNSISYANFGGNSGIDVQITDYGFKVVKNLKDVQTYQESIKSETLSYGKRTETVQYREFTLVTENLNTVDQLYNVSNITGTGGNDTIRGNDKANLIAGGLGADHLFGNAGDDRFMQNINLENDVIDGGSDNDTVDYGGFKFDDSQRKVRGDKGVLADLSVGKIYKFKYQDGREDIFDKVTNIENVFGSSLDDTLIGDAENNILSGGEGNDTISGGDGQDILFGGIGNDSLSGGAGNDQFAQNIDLESDALDGGDGTDTVNYEGLNEFANGKRDNMDSQGVWADLSIGKIYKYKGYKDDVFDTVSNIENVVGTTLNDTLKGNNQDNVLSGGVGNDALFGDKGNDTLIGGAGTDTLDGGDGDDWILQDLEQSVSDMLEGGAGNDAVDYSAAALKEENLILNADFDKALTAADSDYKVNPTGDKQGGQVYVLKNAKDWDVNTPQGLDGANDQFLAVNGGSDASQLFWKQDVKVVSGGTYRFSYMVSGSTNPAKIQLTVDGQAKGVATTVTEKGGWQQVVVEFVASKTGVVKVGLKDLNTESYGNDFLIDKLSLVLKTGIVGDLSTGKVTKFGSSNGSEDRLSNIENLIGTALNDRLTGDAHDNTLSGGAGNDALFGDKGNDTLIGGAGTDTLDGGDGDDYFNQTMELSVSDTMDGGAGSDVADYSAEDMLVGRYVMIYFNASVTKSIAPSSFMVFNNASNLVQSKLSAADGRWIQVDLGSSLSIDAISAQFASAPGAYSVYVGNTDMRGLSVAQLEVLNDVTVSRQDGKTKALSMKAGGIVADLTQGTVLKRYSGFVTANDRISNIEDVVGTTCSDTLNGDANDNTLSGDAGSDALFGNAGKDILFGGDDSDTLNGGADDDVLIGGRGSDTMLGDIGNDYFQQAMELSVSDTMDGGAGSDAVDYSAAGVLVGRYVMIYFNASVTKPIAPSSFMVFNNASNLVQSKLSAEDGRWIQVDLGSSLSIDAVSAQFANAPGAYSVYVGNTDMRGLSVAQLEVLNDVTVSRQDGKTKALSMKAGGIVADLTQGTVLKRYSGFVTANDRISNIENVVGTDYSDTLIGDANDNAFAGCAGNDTLMGGAGNDAYVVGLGDGQDTIIDNDNTVSNLDALIFKSGVSKEQLWFRRIGSDLEVSIIGSGDKVSIQSWYLGTQNQIERIVTSDESNLFSTDVEKMVQAMASFSPPAPGQTKLPANYQNALASVIASNWH